MKQVQEAFVGVEIPKRQEELLFVTEIRPIGKLLGLGNIDFKKCIGFFVRVSVVGLKSFETCS